MNGLAVGCTRAGHRSDGKKPRQYTTEKAHLIRRALAGIAPSDGKNRRLVDVHAAYKYCRNTYGGYRADERRVKVAGRRSQAAVKAQGTDLVSTTAPAPFPLQSSLVREAQELARVLSLEVHFGPPGRCLSTVQDARCASLANDAFGTTTRACQTAASVLPSTLGPHAVPTANTSRCNRRPDQPQRHAGTDWAGGVSPSIRSGLHDGLGQSTGHRSRRAFARGRRG